MWSRDAHIAFGPYAGTEPPRSVLLAIILAATVPVAFACLLGLIALARTWFLPRQGGYTQIGSGGR